MPSRTRPAMYNMPTLRNGGFGALQVEAITNRPLSIARRHLAASQLRMRDIEPDQLTSSEWVRFLVMTERERDRWMSDFIYRRRRDSESSNASSSSAASSSSNNGGGADHDRDTAAAMAAAGYDKAEEARRESEQQQQQQAREYRVAADDALATPQVQMSMTDNALTPSVSVWAREFDEQRSSTRRPRARRAATDSSGVPDMPPSYENAVRARTPPPAYEPRSDNDASSPPPTMRDTRRIRFDV